MQDRDVAKAAQLLELARSSPRELLAHHEQSQPDDFGPVATSIRSRALGIAHRDAGNTDRALVYLEAAAAVAERHDLSEELAEAHLTMASLLFIKGSPSAALLSLSVAESGASDHLRAKIEFQRATIFSRSGRYREAIAAFERAIEEFVQLGDLRFEGMARRNLGRLALGQGELSIATENLERARALFEQIGSSVQLPFIDHDLGLTQIRRGELMSALQQLASAEQEIDAAGGSAVHIQLDRCEGLLSAGLFRDARNLARAVGARMQRTGMHADHAEALLMEATASLLAGEPRSAERAAARATAALADQARPGWMASARHIELEAKVRNDGPSLEHLDTAVELLDQLADTGQFIRRAQLELLIIGLALQLGRLDVALASASRLDPSHGPVEVRIGAWLGRAQLAAHRGDRSAVLRAASRGMLLLEHHQALVGASDIRAGLSSHGVALGQLALAATVAGQGPRRMFDWMERTRAKALLIQPLRPTEYEELEEQLSELRSLSAQMRRAGPHEQAALIAGVTRTQARVRRTSHGLPSSGPITLPDRSEDIIGAIGNRALVQMGIIGDELWAVMFDDGRARRIRLGRAQPTIVAADEARRRLTRAAQPGPSKSEHLAQAQRAAHSLGRMVLDPLGLHDDRPLVLVPPAALYSAPWGLTPNLSLQTFSVAPSATLWNRAGAHSMGVGAVSIGGPELRHAAEESLLAARVHGSAERFSPRQAATGRVLSSLEGKRIAHFACHGHFDIEQPLFSSITLADGDLTIYDLAGVESPPGIMVLASCQTGRSGDDASEELLGLAGTLLSAGVQAVVASVADLPDSTATVRLMVILHEALRDGATVAEALLEVRRAAKSPVAKVAAYSLLCFGYGEATLTK